MQKDQKRNLLILLAFCLWAISLLWVIWHYYEKRLEEIDRDIQTLQIGVFHAISLPIN